MTEQILETFSREGNAFIERHKDDLPPAGLSLGGLTWGIYRAVMECPNCPGHYRVPVDPEGKELYSPCCGAQWYLPSEPAHPTPLAVGQKRAASSRRRSPSK